MVASGVRGIRRKLLLVVLATSTLALLISGAAMLVYELHDFQQTWVNDLTAQADVVGLAAAPALQFEDPKAAHDYLALLKAKPNIKSAVIYTANGSMFASYSASGENVKFPKLPNVDGFHVVRNELLLYRRIIVNDEILGTVGLRADYNLKERIIDYVGILGIVLVLGLIGSAVASWRLQRSITQPILAVTEVAREVIDKRDYSLRAPKSSNDEVGVLVDAFNAMLNELGQRAETLEESNEQLALEVRERRRAEQATATSERRTQTLVRTLTQVVWVAQADGSFIGDQSSWSRYTGQSEKDYQGLGWHRAFDSSSEKQLDAAWDNAFTETSEFELELSLRHGQSDDYRLVTLRAVPVFDDDGCVAEWVGAVNDIEDQRRSEAALRQLNVELEDRVAARTQELETANKELESFSYSVSHDLRAPLRAISGFSDLMWKDHSEALDDEASRKLTIIRQQADRMGILIDDLLAFSRLGRKAVEKTDLDMTALVSSTFEQIHDVNENDKLNFHLGRLPEAHGDRSLLQQVWSNLLSNAIKFSSQVEDPVVEVGAVVENTENIYYVRDNGAGFDPRFADKLFGVFQRLHSDDEFPGTGVGLALAQRIVAKHQGRIWAYSKPGEGATFHFSLPRYPE